MEETIHDTMYGTKVVAPRRRWSWPTRGQRILRVAFAGPQGSLTFGVTYRQFGGP